MTARRSLLASMGGATAMAASLPGVAIAARVGPVETMARQLAELGRQSVAAEEAAGALSPRHGQRAHLVKVANALSERMCDLEQQILDTPPETAIDAVLLVALVAHQGLALSYCDMDNEATAVNAREVAGIGRRAADFLAASLGQNIGAVLGGRYDHPEAKA